MACGCSTHSKDRKATVDRVREKGKGDMKLNTPHIISCSCGEDFTIEYICSNFYINYIYYFLTLSHQIKFNYQCLS